MKKITDLVSEAKKIIRLYDAPQAQAKLGEEDVVFVDVRDEPEVHATGAIPGAVHASRGMLEFYIASDSPYHATLFAADREFIFYCKSGGRSALAARAARELGVARVASLDGGLNAWQNAGGPVERMDVSRVG